MLSKVRSTFACGVCSTALSCSAAAVDLFDATLGTTPADQGWLFLANPILTHSVTQTPGSMYTTLDSFDARSEQGGYFSALHPNLPAPLDRTAGFALRIGLRIDAEGHNPRDDNADGLHDRAGFSIIVIASDLLGLELAFWEDEIWAYADDSAAPQDLFTHAEGVAFDTTAAVTDYELYFHGDTYSLLVGEQMILCGPLRDYSAFTGPADVYETPSFVFFGDDTASAESRSEIAYLSIEDAANPCPADLAPPCMTLDFTDVLAFLSAFAGEQPQADFAAPTGTWDFSDVLAFLVAFGAGCP